MTSHRLQERIDWLQAQRATEWLEVLKARRPEDMAAFAQWCRDSPVHIREFLEATWLYRELSVLDAGQSLDVDALLLEVTPALRFLPEMQPPKASAQSEGRHPLRRRWRYTVAASVALLLVGAAAIWIPRAPSPHYATEIGEQRTVELADHSVVKLNTDSDISVGFAPNARTVELRRGEAVFTVAQDRQRPFRVETRRAIITALGTQFNVYERPDGTIVTVLDGRVRVVSRGKPEGHSKRTFESILARGEEVRVFPDGSIHPVAQPDVERVAAWSNRRLKFERTPLDEIVREFNRYNRAQLRLEGIAPGTRFYRGIFDAGDPGALADLLERESDLVVERRGEEMLIKRRP